MFHPFSSHVNYHRVGQLEGQLGLGHAASPSVDVKAKLLGAAATRWRLNCPGKTKGSTSRVRYKHGIRKLQFFMGPKSWSNMVQHGPTISGEAREVFGQTKWQQDKARQTDQGRCPGAKGLESAWHVAGWPKLFKGRPYMTILHDTTSDWTSYA